MPRCPPLQGPSPIALLSIPFAKSLNDRVDAAKERYKASASGVGVVAESSTPVMKKAGEEVSHGIKDSGGGGAGRWENICSSRSISAGSSIGVGAREQGVAGVHGGKDTNENEVKAEREKAVREEGETERKAKEKIKKQNDDMDENMRRVLLSMVIE